MAGLTRRAGGWTFSSQKNSLLIKHSEDKTRKTFDKNTIQRLVTAVNSCCASDTSTLLSLLPPLDRVVAGLPSTLPIVEALYTKCEQLGLFVSDSLAICVLKAEEVFCRIVWWTAYCEQEDVVGRSGRLGTMPSIQSMENSVSHILQLISRQFPSLVSRAAADKRQLEVCLESLGCHGLVNCSQGLIRLHEASRTEIGNHEEKLKKSLTSLKELVEKTTNYNLAEDPSSASHQRQMSRRLSEIFDRLKFNEGMEKLLQTASTNHHLNSLLRISRKRVASDRLLIGLFHAFNRAAPSDFRIDQLDPVIAELIVVFNNTYEKVLQLSNFHEFDSGCSTESTSEKGTCMPKHLSEVSTSSPDPLSLYANEHIYDTTEEVSIVREKHVDSRLSHAKSTSHLDTLDCEGMRRFDHMTRFDNGKQDETLRLRLHIEHLKNELANAREQVEHLTQKSAERTERLWPEPDYPEATNFYNCSSQTDVRNLISRFSNLFHGDRSELTDVLNSLPEFRGSEELQLKTLLSVVVLAYRSVSESVQKRIATIWDVIEEGENRTESEEANMLDLALFRHIYRKAKSQHGMQNAKEVTSQIWKTLYDFPSLKTCTRFNRFVLECVDVSWDLVAGIDGRYPRMLLDYEASLFDQGKHTRTRDSNPLSSVIRTFIWPGLVDQKTGRVLLRAVVAT